MASVSCSECKAKHPRHAGRNCVRAASVQQPDGDGRDTQHAAVLGLLQGIQSSVSTLADRVTMLESSSGSATVATPPSEINDARTGKALTTPLDVLENSLLHLHSLRQLVSM